MADSSRSNNTCGVQLSGVPWMMMESGVNPIAGWELDGTSGTLVMSTAGALHIRFLINVLRSYFSFITLCHKNLKVTYALEAINSREFV